MNFYEFALAMAKNHPVLTFIAICAIYYAVKQPFWVMNRFFRSRNIKHHGWPPAPIDADGDVVWPKGDDQ